MISVLLKSSIILTATALVAAILRRQSAALRHAVWTAGLIAALALPFLNITLPSWEVPVNPAAAILETGAGLTAILPPAAWPSSVPATDYAHYALTLWLAGAAAGLLLLLFGAARLGWIALRAEPVTDARWIAIAEDLRRALEIRRPVRLLQNHSVPFLGTWGITGPRILIPSGEDNWSSERIRMVLAHELSHIKRHDWPVQVLAEAARAIYWFNPLFWLACGRLRRESEHACDDAVVRMGADGTDYAEELLSVTRALRGGRQAQTPMLAMAQPSHLERRLTALLNPSLNRLAATPWAVLVVALIAILLTLPLAALRDTKPEAPVTPVTNEGTPIPNRPLAASAPPQSPALPTVLPTPPPEPVKTSPAPEPIAMDPVECPVSQSVQETRTVPVKSAPFGNGPWHINDDRTIWVWDQPYVAGKEVNTIWMRPANSQLEISGRRLDGAAPPLQASGSAGTFAGYLATVLVFPTPGCWEVTGTAAGSTLTFVTEVGSEAR